jgi:uncharacterized protein (DUF58 family)
MIDPEIFKKVRRIQFKTTRMVTEMFSGDYRSVFKGRGMEFESVREYQVGDDIRSIDWNVTARMNRPFVKEFREERELTVFFIVDISSSMDLASHAQSKREKVAEICAVLAFTAIQNNDKVGLLLFSDGVEKVIPPAKGKQHVLRVIRELLATGTGKLKGKRGTRLTEALDTFGRIQRKRTVCFVLSDFLTFENLKSLRVLKKKHDLVVMHISDPLEKEFPTSGLVSLEDLETGTVHTVDFSSPRLSEDYRENMEERLGALFQEFKRGQISHLSLSTEEDYLHKLTAFFKEREKKIYR